jgi:hypothetical protein
MSVIIAAIAVQANLSALGLEASSAWKTTGQLMSLTIASASVIRLVWIWFAVVKGRHWWIFTFMGAPDTPMLFPVFRALSQVIIFLGWTRVLISPGFADWEVRCILLSQGVLCGGVLGFLLLPIGSFSFHLHIRSLFSIHPRDDVFWRQIYIVPSVITIYLGVRLWIKRMPICPLILEQASRVGLAFTKRRAPADVLEPEFSRVRA